MDIRYLIFASGCSILTLIYTYLGFLVVKQRRKFLVPYLTNEDTDFVRRFRAHANFVEYVPMTLILMAVSIVFQIHYILLACLMILFILARVFHAYGLIVKEKDKNFNYRMSAMVCTYLIMIGLALYNLTMAIYVFAIIL